MLPPSVRVVRDCGGFGLGGFLECVGGDFVLCHGFAYVGIIIVVLE